MFPLHVTFPILFLSLIQGEANVSLPNENDGRDLHSQPTESWTAGILTTENVRLETGRTDSQISLSLPTEDSATAGPTPEDDGNVGNTTNTAETHESHSVSHSTLTSPGYTSRKGGDSTTRRPTPDLSKVRQHNERIFYYDYVTLMIYGLIFSAVLFILGILILTCGRCRNISSCQRKERRKYNITQN
ncbi:FXYD domain-containing ion transport regulator 5-like isoform X1 [Rhinatrema bivittatum]|uniref:FXYD domain-containing ion transport regulator 5-like isoform X1 n=1 Tax=Rhinatrema bivittatum TaxID=194408 RepID=UPI00112CB16D|nr:FXYD domain-containing ion transport regulator 5-like isoform X1 [Rhinatrema bivittatum]